MGWVLSSCFGVKEQQRDTLWHGLRGPLGPHHPRLCGSSVLLQPACDIAPVPTEALGDKRKGKRLTITAGRVQPAAGEEQSQP